jgi:hypothetical protein
MSEFKVDYAKIEFKHSHGKGWGWKGWPSGEDDKAYVMGELEIVQVNGDGVDISDDVTVTVGPLSETVTMTERGGWWISRRPRGDSGIIRYMWINWRTGRFSIRIDQADFTGITNPVTIGILIGNDCGEETIQMRERKYYWKYRVSHKHW